MYKINCYVNFTVFKPQNDLIFDRYITSPSIRKKNHSFKTRFTFITRKDKFKTVKNRFFNTVF